MKPVLAIVAMTAGWLLAGAVLMPASAMPFSPASRLTEEPIAVPARWVCDGSTSFEITDGNRTERGTDVILYLNAESEEFLEDHRINAILDIGEARPALVQG